jgi:hypothetical protein
MANEMLLVQLVSNSNMNVKLNGDPATVAQMLRTAMEARQDIAAAFMAAVIHYAHAQGWDCGELEKMVSIPGFDL